MWACFRLKLPEWELILAHQLKHKAFKLLLGVRLGTDHNHKTGLVRGLLDWRLNRAYGAIEAAFPANTSAVLRALADFHDNPPATAALGEKRYGLTGKAQYKKKMVYGPPKETS